MRTAFGVLPSYCWWTLELLGERDYLVPLLPLDFMGIEERKDGGGVLVGGCLGAEWSFRPIRSGHGACLTTTNP